MAEGGVYNAAEMRVLIIDSDAAFVREAKKTLGERGVEVQIVEDGVAGMDQARAGRPDAIVLAVELGDRPQAGYSICNRIKKDDELKDIPLLLVSSLATEEIFEQHRRLKTRADRYLRKPVSMEAFLSTLEEMVPGLLATDAPNPEATRTARFAWTGLDLEELETTADPADEPLFADAPAPSGDDEDLNLDDLLVPFDGVEEREEPSKRPAPAPMATPALAAAAAAAPAPALATASAPQASLRPDPRLEKELESLRAERDELRRKLEVIIGERDEAQAARAAAEEKLRDASAAKEAAERKVEELRKLAQSAGALQERLEELREALSAREAEILRYRKRLEQIEQVRQRTQKALAVAGELLQSIRLEPER